MKNPSYKKFYVDLNHPRILLRNYEGQIEEEDQSLKITHCPIIIFHPLRNTDSKITLNNEPCLKKLYSLKEVYGIDSILTCLKHKNYDNDIKNITNEFKTNLIEFNLNITKLSDLTKPTIKEKFIDNVLEIYDKLSNEKITLLIHKASGDMKITIILYSLLRLSGEKKEESIEIIRYIKNGNKKSIGDFNIECIEKNIIGLLLERFKNYISKY